MKHKFNEAGRTMLEMMGVLAIMGLIMYGAVVGIGFGVDLYKATATHGDIEEMSQTIIDLYSWSDGFGTSGDQNIGTVLCQKNLAWSPCGTKPLSRWTEGNIDIKSAPDRSYFYIRVTGIPEVACNRLEKMDYQNMCVKVCEGGAINPATSCEDRRLILLSQGADERLCDSACN